VTFATRTGPSVPFSSTNATVSSTGADAATTATSPGGTGSTAGVALPVSAGGDASPAVPGAAVTAPVSATADAMTSTTARPCRRLTRR
jgi:hypothetical protein